MSIFPARALLQVNIAGLVENQDVNGAMAQVIPMHFRAAGVAAEFDHFYRPPGTAHWSLEHISGHGSGAMKFARAIHCSNDNSSARAFGSMFRQLASVFQSRAYSRSNFLSCFRL